MATSIKALVSLFCSSSDGADKAIEGLKAALKRKSAAVVYTECLPLVAGFYGVTLVDGKKNSKAALVLDKTAPKYETARKRLQRLVLAITGGGKNDTDFSTLTGADRALAKQLSKCERRAKISAYAAKLSKDAAGK